MDWKGHATFANTFPILTLWDNVLIYHIFICQSVRCMVPVSDDTQPLLYYFNDCWQNQFDKAKRANKQTKETLFKSWQWLTCVCVWATELVHTNLWSAVKFNHDFKKGKQRLHYNWFFLSVSFKTNQLISTRKLTKPQHFDNGHQPLT